MTRHFPWNVLGIDATQDTAAVRKAYADALRGLDVDKDIAGYADLRRARDEALWLAAQGTFDDVDDVDDGSGGEGVFGLGSRDDGPAADSDYADEPVDSDFDDAWDDYRPDPYRPDPLHHPAGADATPDRSEAQARAADAWQALLDILYPEGAVSEEAVSHAELEAGLTHLAALFDHAQATDLAEYDALDHALADVLANTWPRSAPFVEPANAAFHWLDEAGQLEERYALRFLNARLKGMRFHDKVQAPDHPLHKAWMELSRPGQAGFVDRLRVKRLEIDKLLTGLRRHYPELESHLAPERVASWEGTTNASGVSDTGPRWVRGIVIVLVVLAIPRLISAFTDPRPDPSAPPVAEAAAALQAATIDLAVADVFGEGTGMAEVRAADPVFADQLQSALNDLSRDETAPLALARRQALGSAEVADRNTLAIRADLKGVWIVAARRQSDAVCRKLIRGDLSGGDLALTEAERDRERALLRQLLAAQVLGHQAKGGEVRYSIPGWLVADMLARSGFSEDRLVAALTDPKSADRCAAEAALIAAALATSQSLPEDVLRGL